jgi:catalase (peroxidase I)
MGEDFSYAKEFNSLDLHAVVKALHTLMIDSQDTSSAPLKRQHRTIPVH